MIIVEGPDGAGKSTLVEELADEFGLKVGERATKDRDRLHEVTRRDTYTALSHELSGDNEPLIWDRLYFSEFVYAPLLARPIAFNQEDQRVIEGTLNALEVPLIMCLPPQEEVVRNSQAAHQMKGVKANIHNIYFHYSRMVHGTRVPKFSTFIYDYTTTPYERIARLVEGYIERRKQRQWT